jgi:hypothetical protein
VVNMNPRAQQAHSEHSLRRVFAYVRLQEMFAKMFDSRQRGGGLTRFLNFKMFACVREQTNKCSLFAYVIPPTALLWSGSRRKAKGKHRG